MDSVVFQGREAPAKGPLGLKYNGIHEDTLAATIALLTLLAIGGVLVIGLESVITLHRDMNTKQSYMLFMTPNSCYKILGAKVLECSLSILITGACFFALAALDITLLFAKEGELNQIWEMIQQFLQQITINGRELVFDLPTIAAVVFHLLTSWISTVCTAYLAVVVSAALLNGKRFNGLLSFVLFLILFWFTGWGTQQAIHGMAGTTIQSMMVSGCIELIFAAIMYVITAQIMEKKLSV